MDICVPISLQKKIHAHEFENKFPKQFTLAIDLL